MDRVGICSNGRGAALVIAVLSLLLVLPALLTGNARGGDMIVHVNWQVHFAPQLWQGVLYPRWLPDINHGFGSPAFFFYPPVAQWAGAIFYPLMPDATRAMDRLILGIVVTSVLGGWGCWRWLRSLALTPAAALFGSACFLLFPYRCFVDFYARSALAELTALSALPWMLYTATLLCSGRKRGFGAYALATGAIWYCNFPTAEIGVLFVTGYIVSIIGLRDVRALTRAALATLCGFLIGAVPLVTTLGLFGYLIDTSGLWSPRLSPASWLLLSGQPSTDPAMFALIVGSITLSIGAGAIGTIIVLRSDRRDLRPVTLFLIGSVVLIAILNTEVSRPFWFPANPLSRIQFPFRLLSAATLAVAGLGALAADVLHRRADGRGRTLRRLLWAGLPMLFLLDATLLGIRTWRDRHGHEPDAVEMVADNMDAMQEFVIGRMAVVEPMFGTAGAVAIDGQAAVQPIAAGNRVRTFSTVALAPATIAVRQFAFTGWSCQVDEGPAVPAGLLPYPRNVPTCVVPAGRHRLTVRLEATGIERIGTLLTIAGLAIALLSILWSRRRATRA